MSYPITFILIVNFLPDSILMSRTFMLAYHFVIVTFIIYCLYNILLNKLYSEIKDIDEMDRFILDSEFKISIDLRNKLDDIFIKLGTFFILLTSSFIYKNLEDKSLDISALKDLLDKEIFFLIGIAFYIVFGGIFAFSSANEKKIKELKLKYKNKINKE